jgi:hypothetical protein
MRKLTLALSVFVSLAVARPAFADLPPPDTSGCNMKVAGDTCQKDDMSAGTCMTKTCSKLDYSDGSPPGTIDYECLVCTSSGDGGSAGASASSSSSGGNTPGESGCSVRNGGMAGALSAWVLGAAVLIWSRRTRTRNRKPRS